jgi:hypothetical protein
MPPSPIQGYDSPGSPTETDFAPDDSASESSTSRQASDKETPSPTSSRPGGSRIGPDGVITFDPLPRQSIRTALILDRFSMSCPIIYCSNDSFLSTTQIMGRPFFDFVAKRDEGLVRSWIDAVKGWGVNERGQPSDGGFGFGKFQLFPRGRDSVYVILSDRSFITHFFAYVVASEWSQTFHHRNHAPGAMPPEAVREFRIMRREPHIPPHRCHARGLIGRVPRQTIRKSRLSLMPSSLRTLMASWSSCGTPPPLLVAARGLNQPSHLSQQHVLRYQGRPLRPSDSRINSYSEIVPPSFLYSRLVFFFYIYRSSLLCIHAPLPLFFSVFFRSAV